MTSGGLSKIFAFIDNDATVDHVSYLRIATDTAVLHVSEEHIIMVDNYPVHASDARVGSNVSVAGEPTRITEISRVTGLTGKHAPLTAEGTLIVDGVLVSSYAGVRGITWGGSTLLSGHTLGVLAHSPLRLACRIFPSLGGPEWHTDPDGRHLWTQTLMDIFQFLDTSTSSSSRRSRGSPMSFKVDYGDGIDGGEAVASIALVLLVVIYCVELAVGCVCYCCHCCSLAVVAVASIGCWWYIGIEHSSPNK